MKHSPAELIGIARQFYPRVGFWPSEPEYIDSPEYRRLVARRKQAGADDGTWRTLLARLRTRFPDCGVANYAMHLAAGSSSASYSGQLHLPTRPPSVGHHMLWFHVSFLVPYYIVFSSRMLLLDEIDPVFQTRKCTIDERFDLQPEEQPYADGLGQEIEATFSGYAQMPREIGDVIIPDLQHDARQPGEATICDCLIEANWMPPRATVT